MLLEVLITVICRESEHIHEDQIQKSLAAFVQRQVHLKASLYKYQESQDKGGKFAFYFILFYQNDPVGELCSQKYNIFQTFKLHWGYFIVCTAHTYCINIVVTSWYPSKTSNRLLLFE